MTEPSLLSLMLLKPSKNRAGYTLVELMVAVSLLMTLGGVCFGFLRSGTELSTKNTALNRSHASLRGVVDHVSDTLQTAEDVPTLMTAAAVTVTGAPAAGIRFDRFLAEPYILVSGTNAIAATATSLTVDYCCAYPAAVIPTGVQLATANRCRVPVPQVGDILIYSTPTGSARARITAVGTPSNPTSTPPRQTVSLTFAAAVGKAASWSAGEVVQARLVRHEAFLVAPSPSGANEMRHYPQFEPIPDLANKANYSVVSDQLMTDAADATPFSLLTVNNDRMVELNIRTRQLRGYDWLAKRQANGFNTYAAVKMRLTSRLHARTQSAY